MCIRDRIANGGRARRRAARLLEPELVRVDGVQDAVGEAAGDDAARALGGGDIDEASRGVSRAQN